MPLRFNKTKETKEFLPLIPRMTLMFQEKKPPLSSVLSASSAVKKSKFRTPVDLMSSDFYPVP
jgi:hypothetical protein